MPTPNSNGKKKAVTPEEKAHQRSLAKIKRLNVKLSKVKQISEHMELSAKKGQPVSSKQVEVWVKHLKDLLNVKDEEN